MAGSHKIYHGDASDVLDRLEDSTVSLVVTSPPYNIGKEYEKDERKTLEEYIEWVEPIVQKIYNKVKVGGNICWQTGNYIDSKRGFFPLDVYFFQMFLKLGAVPRNRIVWRVNFGLNSTRRLSGRYETILWFSKGDSYTFNLDPIRIPQLYPGKRHPSTKGEKAGLLSGNKNGKNPSDFWEFDGVKEFDERAIWDIPNVKANHAEKTEHPCQFPIELAERCLLAFSNPGEAVLDPFLGAGSTAIAALKHDRCVIGIDRDLRYVELANERVRLFLDGVLPMRPSGRPVRRPILTERVAQVPSEWTTPRAAE